MSTVDDKVDRLADKLQQFASRTAAEGGVKAKLARPLAEDADLVRKLKPTLIKARAKGEAPIDQKPGRVPIASSAPQPRKWPKQKQAGGGGGPNPWLVAGVCLVAGIALAKWIDWRDRAHPRD